jgi:hypothetical protein
VPHLSSYDLKLTKLATAQLAGDTLPTSVVLDGKVVDTALFLDRFTSDRREAWPAIAALV